MVAVKRLVASGPVQYDGDVCAPRERHQLPVSVQCRNVDRLVAMPEQNVELVEQTAVVREDLVVLGTGQLDHRLHVPPLVALRILAARCEGVRWISSGRTPEVCGEGRYG